MTARTLKIEDAIRPTRQRIAKGDGVIIPQDDPRNPQDKKPARIENFSPIERYKKRETLTNEQIQAAERYAGDWFMAMRLPRVTGSYEGKSSPSNHEMTDRQVAAGISRDRAIMVIAQINLDFFTILEHVCVNERAAETWAIERKLHPMKGIKTLRLALDRLAIHYGLKKR